jgi:hypothetical protein
MISELPWGVLVACCVARSAIEFHASDRVRPRTHTPNWLLDHRIESRCWGLLALVATAIHFGVMTQWYWAPLLAVLAHYGGVVGAIPFALLVGRSRALPAAYLVWPLCVIWANIAIHGLAQAQSAR